LADYHFHFGHTAKQLKNRTCGKRSFAFDNPEFIYLKEKTGKLAKENEKVMCNWTPWME